MKWLHTDLLVDSLFGEGGVPSEDRDKYEYMLVSECVCVDIVCADTHTEHMRTGLCVQC